MPNISGVEVQIFSAAPFMNIITEVKKLNIDPDKFVIIASGILNQLGIRESSDIDLIVTPDVYESFQQLDGWEEKTWPVGDPTIQKGIFELCTDWGDDTHTYTFEDVKRNSTEIEGINFITLDFLKKWKATKGRNKDLEDVKLIDKYQDQHENLSY